MSGYFARTTVSNGGDWFALCDQFGCKNALEYSFAAAGNTPQDPWAIFCIASHLKDTGLARTAIRHSHLHPQLATLETPVKDTRQVKLPYLLGYLQVSARYGDFQTHLSHLPNAKHPPRQ